MTTIKEIAFLLGFILFSIVLIAIKLKFNSFIFGEGGLFGPEDHSLGHEIKNLVKLRDQGLIDSGKYEEMKSELLLRYKEISHYADKEIQKLERLQKQGVITPEEFEDIRNRLSPANQ
jgi:hypothetical protein